MIDLIISMKALPIRWKGAFVTGLAILLLADTSFTASPTFAQIPVLSIPQTDKHKSDAAPTVVPQEQQRETTKLALTRALAERDRSFVPPSGVPGQDVKERYRLLDGLVTRLNSQLNLINEREELRHARTVAEQTAKSWAGFQAPPPYSVLKVDEIMETVLTARAKLKGLSTNHELFAQQVSQYREAAKQALGMERQATDELERAKSPEDLLSASWQKELIGIRSNNAEAMAVLLALRHEVFGERLGIAKIELDLLERQLAEARKQMVFSQTDLNKALARLKSSRSGLEQELEDSLARDARSRSVLERAQQELRSFTLNHSKESSSPPVEARRDELEARQRAAMAWVESSRFENEVISALITINKSNSTSWEQRYIAVSGTDAEKRRNILKEFRKNRERLRPWLEYAQHQLEMYQAAEREQEARLAKIDEQSPLRAPEHDLLAAIRLQRELAERQKTAVEQAAIERQAWLEDIERSQQSRNLTKKVHDWLGAFPNILRHVWRFELFAIEDSMEIAGQKVVTSRGVTVGKSVGAILLFLIGYWIAAFLGRRVQRIVITRFGVGEHQANVIRRWLLALTVFILMIITLNLARIPLTLFAFLGGALAIGVGFGTQTLIKNFISGILILLERNVQVGDTVDVDGVVGRIITVDIRASTILGFDGVETVIPNSNFLEHKVTNWTHTNTRIRRIVRVGVAYGSMITRVRDILAECGNQHSLVLKDPPPEVLFEDFGDNSLVFALYFWIDYGQEVNPLLVASDLRFMIDQRFAEEHIVFASQQRDIHLDSAQPLRIKIVPPSGTESGPE